MGWRMGKYMGNQLNMSGVWVGGCVLRQTSPALHHRLSGGREPCMDPHPTPPVRQTKGSDNHLKTQQQDHELTQAP